MVFNFWRRYPFWKPKKSGWYQCSVMEGYGIGGSRVLDLYYEAEIESYNNVNIIKPQNTGRWIDYRRQSVFSGYKVYNACRAPIEDNRVWQDIMCERIDVVAWRKLPTPYNRWRMKKHA